MKRILLPFLVAAFVASCGNNTADKTAKKPASAGPETDEDKGLALVAANGCYTCHQVDQASSGPAYSAVAARYAKNDQVIDSLADKVIRGGSGNWGSVPMIAHPDVSKEDARLMVKYVLSLKK